jgi:dimethylargininase
LKHGKQPIEPKLQHTVAIVREIPSSFSRALAMGDDAASSDRGDVSVRRAQAQHARFVAALRTRVPTFLLPPLDHHPDCAFVEDAAVSIGNRAVLTHPGHETRRGEVSSLRTVLEHGLGMHIALDMTRTGTEEDEGSHDEVALCDGGDVLYTGRHLFVGLSSRTNLRAYEALETALGDLVEDVVPVPLPGPGALGDAPGVLHLKSAVTHLDPFSLLIPAGDYGDALVRAMRPEEHGYQVIRLPSLLACNAVVIRHRHVLAQDVECELSKYQLREAARERGMTIDFVNTSELAKKDAALTCCCILLSI